MVMARELNNPQYRFLFDNQSPAHSYYRWKLYSILHGESVSKWRTTPFRMFKHGSYWQPPPVNRYTKGLPDEDYERAWKELEASRDLLCSDKRDRLEEILRNITTERKSISEAMVYCIENADKAEEIVECVVESLLIAETPLNKKVARLYLISDILHNCCAKVANASYYRRGFERALPEIFEHTSQIWKKIDGKMKSEAFKQKIISCVRAWQDWAIYPDDYLLRLQNMFLTLPKTKETLVEKSNNDPRESDSNTDSESDVDGKPLEEEEDKCQSNTDTNAGHMSSSSKFLASKWETIDPDALEKQAVTTSKWDFFDESQPEQKVQNSSLQCLASYNDEDSDDLDGEPMDEDVDGKSMASDEELDGKPMDEETESKTAKSWMDKVTMGDEEKRKILREIEVKVLKYIDDLENGKIPRQRNLTIPQQSEIQRCNLLSEAEEIYHKNQEKTSTTSSIVTGKSKSRSRSSSSSSGDKSSRRSDKKQKRRSKSKSPYRSRSHYSSSSSHSQSSSRKKYRN